MDDELKKKIRQHYLDEYCQKIRAEDNSFLSRIEKFTTRHETTLWGVAGLGIAGLAASAFIFSLGAAVVVPAGVFTVAVLGGWPAACETVRRRQADAAYEKIDRDMDTLASRYKKEILEKEPQQHQAVLKVLEEKEAAAQFEAAAQKRQEEEKTEEARIEALKKARPVKPVLKKD